MADGDFISVFSSENRANIAVYPLDLFVPTELGTAQVRGGATALPAEALALLVMMDGKATVGDMEQKAPHIPSARLRDVLRALVAQGLARAATLSETDEGLNLDIGAFLAAGGEGPSAGAQASADREAASGAPQLEKSGYYVSIARRAVKARNAQGGGRWKAFVVEDDPDMAGLMARLLAGEGFDVECAANRDQVVAGMRKAPLPDVILLDVNLPDVNGFDILQRLKAHPALKAVPVIMVTAEATREGVTRGLAGGADGYVTKPFERAKLLDGVKAILGIGA